MRMPDRRIFRHLFALGVFGWLGIIAVALVATCAVSFVMWARADLPADWFEYLEVAENRDITRADLRRWDRLHDEWPAAPESAQEYSDAGIRIVMLVATQDGQATLINGWVRDHEYYAHTYVLIGFPFECSWSRRTSECINGMQQPQRWDAIIHGQTVYPSHVLFGPLAANVLVYGLLLLAPVIAWRSARMFLRRHRRRCILCGYDLAHTTADRARATCPECGYRP